MVSKTEYTTFAQAPPTVVQKPQTRLVSNYDSTKDPYSKDRDEIKKKMMLELIKKTKEYSEQVRSNSKESVRD